MSLSETRRSLVERLRIPASPYLRIPVLRAFHNEAADRIEELEKALAEEKKLSAAISRDCNATALERNAALSAAPHVAPNCPYRSYKDHDPANCGHCSSPSTTPRSEPDDEMPLEPDAIRAEFRDYYKGPESAEQIAFEAFEAAAHRYKASAASAIERFTLDTPERVCFYEQEFYVLSNFSSFKLNWAGLIFDTAEHAYHWTRFPHRSPERQVILESASAHEAFRFAQKHKSNQRSDWDAIKVNAMKEILRAKADQHEYVRRKLLETGERELVENSWRDPYWGWGPNRDGLNRLGKLWMEVRADLNRLGKLWMEVRADLRRADGGAKVEP